MSRPRPASACSPEAWSFGRLEELWSRFRPLTPYGKDFRDERFVMSERDEIERAYDDADAYAGFAAARADGPDIDRMSFHLRRLPRLPFACAPVEARLELVDLFQVKKFIANYRALCALADERLKERFGLTFASDELAAALDVGGSDPETLFIADLMHPSLPAVRLAADRASAALRSLHRAAKERALSEMGLDFGEREFLVVPNAQAKALLGAGSAAQAVTVEAYDARSCLVRLREGPDVLGLTQELDALLALEREHEAEVIARLSDLVRAEAEQLLTYVEAVRALDLARARAELATDLGMTRPDLGSVDLVASGARFLPCEWECERLGLAYTRLDLALAEPAAVLFGSNMGGKTVALQSLVFLQAAAQSALFVPADGFATSVYPWIGYIGEDVGEVRPRAHAGLSGFGFEIRSFVDSWERARSAGAFLALDEFARTTSSAEAEAILSAVIEALAALPGTRCLVATHFHGVGRVPGVRYLRMRGLDRARATEALDADEPLPARIRRINGLMRYEIVDESPGGEAGSDATTIAALLGLDREVAERAEDLFRRKLGDTAREDK